MRRPAVQLQHAYQYLQFEAGKKVGINMKAYREGQHKLECKKFEKFLVALKRKLVATLSDDQTALLEWDFGTADSCSLGTISKTWAEYADMAETEEKDLPVILSVNDVFFNKSRNPDLEWALHLPMKICSPMLILSNQNKKDPSVNELNREGHDIFQFNVQLSVNKPAPKQKKRKIEETLLGSDNLDSDFVGEADAEEGEIVAATPLPLPEAADPPIPRLTRGKRAAEPSY